MRLPCRDFKGCVDKILSQRNNWRHSLDFFYPHREDMVGTFTISSRKIGGVYSRAGAREHSPESGSPIPATQILASDCKHPICWTLLRCYDVWTQIIYVYYFNTVFWFYWLHLYMYLLMAEESQAFQCRSRTGQVEPVMGQSNVP